MFDRILFSTCVHHGFIGSCIPILQLLFEFFLLFRIHPSFCRRYSSLYFFFITKMIFFVIYLTLKIIVNDLL
ncbi:hypothetical protein BDC45DRAFT_529175 [Circinella umbellata]|nr:hypothetical protein BDC45DRAFT_529175 [Circinella umbellata]